VAIPPRESCIGLASVPVRARRGHLMRNLFALAAETSNQTRVVYVRTRKIIGPLPMWKSPARFFSIPGVSVPCATSSQCLRALRSRTHSAVAPRNPISPAPSEHR